MSSPVKQIYDERHPDGRIVLCWDCSSLLRGSKGTICIAPSEQKRPGVLPAGKMLHGQHLATASGSHLEAEHEGTRCP